MKQLGKNNDVPVAYLTHEDITLNIEGFDQHLQCYNIDDSRLENFLINECKISKEHFSAKLCVQITNPKKAKLLQDLSIDHHLVAHKIFGQSAFYDNYPHSNRHDLAYYIPKFIIVVSDETCPKIVASLRDNNLHLKPKDYVANIIVEFSNFGAVKLLQASLDPKHITR